MAQSLSRVHIHLVFSTKFRRPLLIDAVRQGLHAVIISVLRAQGCVPEIVNSVEDHIHILFALSRTVPLSQVVQQVKSTSSRWLKTQHPALRRFAWQGGYGAFAVSERQVKRVYAYIARQQEHHAKRSFKQEYRSIMRAERVAFDERYLWD